MPKDRVILSLRHARKTLRFHRRLADRRATGRVAPRTQYDRTIAVADLLTDLKHYAARYELFWDEIERKSEMYLESDKED